MSDLERAKKYLDMIPNELRGSPNDLVQLLATMVAEVESQQATITEQAAEVGEWKTMCGVRWNRITELARENAALQATITKQAAEVKTLRNVGVNQQATITELTTEKANILANTDKAQLRLVTLCDERQATIDNLEADVRVKDIIIAKLKQEPKLHEELNRGIEEGWIEPPTNLKQDDIVPTLNENPNNGNQSKD